MIVGYIFNGLPKEILLEQQQVLNDYCNDWKIDCELSDEKAWNNVISDLVEGDTVVVYDYTSLNMGLLQFKRIMEKFEKLKINIQYARQSNSELHFLNQIIKKEKEIISSRTKTSIERAKINGTVLGRPHIPEDKQAEIYYMSNVQKMTMREIASALQISLGTCHKYAQYNCKK